MVKKKKKKKKINKNKKINILLEILCCIFLIVLIGLIIYIITIKNNFNKKETVYKEQLAKQKQAGNENYVFLGDSLTDWYPMDNYYEDDEPIVNSGFAGYKTTDLIENMDKTVYRYNPTKVFLQMGTNDLNSSNPDIETAYNNIIKIIKNIEENRPQAKIYLESIYPINKNVENQTTEERETVDIVELNKKLMKYCEENDIKFLDIYDLLADGEGNLKAEYTYDGLHLNDEGYQVLTTELKKCLKEN